MSAPLRTAYEDAGHGVAGRCVGDGRTRPATGGPPGARRRHGRPRRGCSRSRARWSRRVHAAGRSWAGRREPIGRRGLRFRRRPALPLAAVACAAALLARFVSRRRYSDALAIARHLDRRLTAWAQTVLLPPRRRCAVAAAQQRRTAVALLEAATSSSTAPCPGAERAPAACCSRSRPGREVARVPRGATRRRRAAPTGARRNESRRRRRCCEGCRTCSSGYPAAAPTPPTHSCGAEEGSSVRWRIEASRRSPPRRCFRRERACAARRGRRRAPGHGDGARPRLGDCCSTARRASSEIGAGRGPSRRPPTDVELPPPRGDPRRAPGRETGRWRRNALDDD